VRPGRRRGHRPGRVGPTKAAISAALRAETSTDEGMARFLDALFGAGTWTYDPSEDVWVVPDPKHVGPGRGFVIVERGGTWFKAVLPPAGSIG
jgi:hypothetical protein